MGCEGPEPARSAPEPAHPGAHEEPLEEQPADAQPEQVQEEQFQVQGQQRGRNDQGDDPGHDDPFAFPPGHLLRVCGRRVADRLECRPDGQPDDRLDLRYDHAG